MSDLLTRASTPQPNYKNPELHGEAFLVLGSTLFAFACLFVFARLYARLFIVRRLGSDDFFIILGLLTRAAHFAVSDLLVYKWYVNHHLWDIPRTVFGDLFKGLWINHHIAYASLMCIKVSVLLFYLRVLSRAHYVVMTRIIIGSIVFVVLYTVAITFAYTFNCMPVKSYWLSHVKSWAATHKYACRDIHVIPMFAAVMNCVTDFWITILPIAFIGRLNLPRNQRRGLYIVFGLGFLVVISSGIQAYLIHKMLFERRADVTWYYYDVLLWAEFESNVAIICACAPALKAFATLFRKEKKSPQTFFGGASIGGSKAKTFGNGSQKVSDSRTRETDSERDNLDIEEGKEHGDWSWPSSNPGAAVKVVTVEREAAEKREA